MASCRTSEFNLRKANRAYSTILGMRFKNWACQAGADRRERFCIASATMGTTSKELGRPLHGDGVLGGNTPPPHSAGAQKKKPYSRPEDWPKMGFGAGLTALRSVSSLRRVGAHLAVRAPPGTVRATLTAYGSTSETAERHNFPRGQRLVSFVSRPQVSLGPVG